MYFKNVLIQLRRWSEIICTFHAPVLPLVAICTHYTIKPVNKTLPRERQNIAFIDKWSLFGGYFILFYQGRAIEVWPLFTGWSLFRGGL